MWPPRFGELKLSRHERKPAVTALTPEQVVEAQLLAFNARDLTEFLAHYATDAKMYAHPSTLIATGHTELSPYFASRFRDSRLHSEVLERIVMGSMVVDHERISRTFEAGAGTIELLASYEVHDAQITRCWLLFGPEVLDSDATG
jgi:hypothetical protein